MRKCSIPHCDNKHEARGYCKKHYHSFLKYGDPLFVEEKIKNQEKLREEKLKAKEQTKKSIKKTKVCIVKDCNNPAQAKNLCQKHYQRFIRKGNLEVDKKRNVINSPTCLVLGCNNPHKRHGFCSTHLLAIKENQTPYKPKIIKLCGVPECEEPHYGKGLCKSHYYEWSRIVKKYDLGKFVNLK